MSHRSATVTLLAGLLLTTGCSSLPEAPETPPGADSTSQPEETSGGDLGRQGWHETARLQEWDDPSCAPPEDLDLSDLSDLSDGVHAFACLRIGVATPAPIDPAPAPWARPRPCPADLAGPTTPATAPRCVTESREYGQV
ncbi:hypothetical protein [Streptomyces johnsoniae]|uniref:Secreted protein n=1 Tax=Streptomyces johnsoniae TaxID=3075532 RepID=A0ABU2S456_9ACTN|nr:hypothetical protein [Streptomyces sp. DSM 41886]MDT0443768.1 hypothetical protein [Streptomyces sp. DSM 41886]